MSLRHRVALGFFAAISATGLVGGAQAAGVTPVLTFTTVLSNANPSFPGEDVTFFAKAGTSGGGTISFQLDDINVIGCVDLPTTSIDIAARAASCTIRFATPGQYEITAFYSGDQYFAASTGSVMQVVLAPEVTGATVVGNPYGAFTVQGATLNGNTLGNFGNDVVLNLGPNAAPGTFQIEFDTFRLGPGQTFTVNPGAAGQGVQLIVNGGDRMIVSGSVRGTGNLAIRLDAPSGLNVNPGGTVDGGGGLFVDTLNGSFFAGDSVVNNGILDGGSNLDLYGSRFTGGGIYAGDAIELHTYGSTNNPENGQHYLDNGIDLYPGAQVMRAGPNDVATAPFTVLINAYGTQPQVINLKLNGSPSVWMPSAWPGSFPFPANNAVIAPGATRAAGVPEPAYGGGQMILNATGPLVLYDGGAGGTANLVFPGGVVLRSLVSIDFAGVTLNQGWTTTGRAFQGVFVEAPVITDSKSPRIKVYSNDLNWINFSTVPAKPVQALRLVRNGDGSASFANADVVSTHLNSYSLVTEAAADGLCWTCLINPQQVDLTGP